LHEIGQTAPEQGTSSDSMFRQILSHKTVNLLAFFILVYVGVEVTVGGS
jgi:fucose permease